MTRNFELSLLTLIALALTTNYLLRKLRIDVSIGESTFSVMVDCCVEDDHMDLLNFLH